MINKDFILLNNSLNFILFKFYINNFNLILEFIYLIMSKLIIF